MKRRISLTVSLIMLMQLLLSSIPVFAESELTEYTVPESPSVTYNMNIDWKYKRPGTDFPLADAAASVVKDGKNFYDVDYDDSDWETVSVPHAINALESFDGLAADAGEGGLYRGFSLYRKHITVPASDAGKKLIMEFEAVRQSVYLYVNGQMAGYYEAGITAMGFDITPYVNYGADNVIAVATDNASDRGQAATWGSSGLTKVTRETKPGNTPGDGSGFGYQWNTKDFNEVQGGITGNVNLYAKNKVYQTLPLYSNMKTKGNYIYATDFDIRGGKATINVEAEIRNESDADKELTLEVDIVKEETEDVDGTSVTKEVLVNSFSSTGSVKQAGDKDAHFLTVVPSDAYDESPSSTSWDTVDVSYIKASAVTEGLEFWSPDAPVLYKVYTVLKDGDTVIDVQEKTTGFRKVTYDITDGGLKINDQKVWLTGYAQRATDEWAVIGVGNDWVNDIDMQLVKESNANFIRWMHVAPKPAAIRSGDKYGVVSVCPAGDKEGDVDGRAWAQRAEVMRDAMIYFRNSPSILFWETGNNAVTAAHQQQFTDMKAELDPNGQRFSGCRTLSSTDQINATEWVGTMLNRHADGAKGSMAAVNKYVPIIETEYAREEAPRRVWDDFSPPDYDYNNKWLGPGASKQDGYDVHDLTSEDLALVNVGGYNEFYSDRVGGSSGKNYYTAAAALVWSDSNQHTRNSGSENCRTSGRVDPVRIKKQSFYAYQAMQATEPTINIIGHWNYPQLTEDNYWYDEKEKVGTYYQPTGEKKQRNPLKKTVYVVGSADVARVELFVNDVSVGECSRPTNTFLYSFPNIDVTQSGKVTAKAYNLRDEVIAEDEIVTAGEASTLRLTPVTGPDGLIADGSDVMYFDVEVVDADGNVCPLNYDRIELSVNGEGVLLGGYNSGEGDTVSGYGRKDVNEIGAGFVYAECGVNRVFVKSTRNAGPITLSASLEGKLPVTYTIESTELAVKDGLALEPQRSFKQGQIVSVPPQTVDPLKSLGKVFSADWNTNVEHADVTDAPKDEYKVTVNGTAVTGFTETPYRPDKTTGVLAEIIPVLNALNAAGADIAYNVNTSQKPDYTDGGLPIVEVTSGLRPGYTKIEAPNGSTTLYVNNGENKNLLNAELYASGNDIVADIAAVLGYLNDVEASMDESTHTLYITYAPHQEGAAIEDNGNGTVNVTLGTASKGLLIFASYDENGKMIGVDMQDVNSAYDQITYAPSGLAEGAVKKVMLWSGINGSPLCNSVILNTAAVSVDTMSAVLAAHMVDESLANETVIVEETEEEAIALEDEAVTEEIQEEAIEEAEYAELEAAINENYDSVIAYNDGETAVGAATSEDGAPDGTKYLSFTSGGDINDVCSIGYDTMEDMIWEADMKLVGDGGGFSIRNKGNKNYGTCIHMHNNHLAIQTGGSSYTEYSAVPVDKWMHIELKGRYSAPDARIDMTVYSYEEDGTMTLVDTYPAVNLRNLSAGNKTGASAITLHSGAYFDNIRVIKLGADALEITEAPESIKGGNTAQIEYAATRQGDYITKPAVSWSVYNADDTAELNDEDITISATGLLNVGLNAQSQTIHIRATAESGVYASKAVTVEAVNAGSVKFDKLELTTEQEYVNADQPMTINVKASKNGEPVELAAGDLIWYATDAADLRKLGDNLRDIKIENGVITVDKRTVAQNITVRAADPTDVVRGSIPVYIKSSDALEGNDEGAKDRLLNSNAAETVITNVELKSGAPDGTSYYSATGDVYLANLGANTSTDLVFDMDVRFASNTASVIPVRNDNGKLSTCLVVHENGGKTYLAEQTSGSRFTDLVEISFDKWYHLTWIGKVKTYSSIILEEYDENGNRVNRTVKQVGRRNDEPIEHIKISAGTEIDNIRALAPSPTSIEIESPVQSVLAGNTVQFSAKAFWNEVEMLGLDGTSIKFDIYDAEDKYPLESDQITVDANGLAAIAATAGAQDVYVRVTSVNGGLYDSKKLTVLSSDVLEVTGINVNTDETLINGIKVNKNFDTYKDEVTFVTAIYGEDGTLKKSDYTLMYADGLTAGANTVAVNVELPAGFDKAKDTIKVYVVTKVRDIKGSDDKTVTAQRTDGAVTVEGLPAFTSDVVVMVLKPGTDVDAVSADSIAYFGQYTAQEAAAGITAAVAGADTGYIVKIGGAVNGIHAVYTGICE